MNSSHFGIWSFQHLVKSTPKVVVISTPSSIGTWSIWHLCIINVFLICTFEDHHFIDIFVFNIYVNE